MFFVGIGIAIEAGSAKGHPLDSGCDTGHDPDSDPDANTVGAAKSGMRGLWQHFNSTVGCPLTQPGISSPSSPYLEAGVDPLAIATDLSYL